MRTFYRLLTLTYHDSLNKGNLTWLGITVGAFVLFSLQLLTLHDVFADRDDYTICSNHVWYPKGTDCKVALKQYREEWGITDDEEEESNQEDNKLLVPDEFKGTLTKEQKEALTKENPNWEFDKSTGLIPNSLEGTETPEQNDALAKSDIEWEYEWEDTDYNPVPGTPSYKAPNQRTDIKEFNDDGTYDLDGDPSTGIEVDDPVSASHERNEDTVEIHNDTPQVESDDDEANVDRSYEYEGEDEDTETEEEEEFEEDEYQAEEEDDEADEEESEDDSGDSKESGGEEETGE